MAKPTLYILCGLPFAGKTTIARKLGEKPGMHHIEVDAVKREMGIGLGGEPTSEPEWEEIFAESQRRLMAALQCGENVLFDATNYDRGVRDRLRKIANQQGARSAVIYVATNADMVNKRRQHNQVTKQRYQVPEEDLHEVVAGLEVPTDDENVLWYDPSMPVDDWIARTFQ